MNCFLRLAVAAIPVNLALNNCCQMLAAKVHFKDGQISNRQNMQLTKRKLYRNNIVIGFEQRNEFFYKTAMQVDYRKYRYARIGHKANICCQAYIGKTRSPIQNKMRLAGALCEILPM